MDHNGQDDLKITGVANQGEGPLKYPFGYVYFNDGSRVGFAPTREVAIWDAGGDKYREASARHLVMAQEHLESKGIEFPAVKPTGATHVRGSKTDSPLEAEEDLTVGELVKLLKDCDQKAKVRYIDVDAKERRVVNVVNGNPVDIYESTE